MSEIDWDEVMATHDAYETELEESGYYDEQEPGVFDEERLASNNRALLQALIETGRVTVIQWTDDGSHDELETCVVEGSTVKTISRAQLEALIDAGKITIVRRADDEK
jgi:hypothetical protein